MPAARGGDGGGAPPGGLGAPQLVARSRAARADGPRRELARATKGRRRRRRRGRLPRALRHARREADGAWPAGRVQPPGLPPRHARRRSWSLPAPLARRWDPSRAGQRRLQGAVADTEAHAAFFRRAFGLAEERVAVALVGADEPLFRPGWHPPEPFHVLFVGKLIPLHGLETILAAAAQVPEVRFCGWRSRSLHSRRGRISRPWSR